MTDLPGTANRSNEELLEDLSVSLREVGVYNAQLPDGSDVRHAIDNVKVIHAEAICRSLDVSQRVEQLEVETRWPLRSMLEAALHYPDAIPYIDPKEIPRCGECRGQLPGSAALSLCDTCLSQAISQLASGHSRNHIDVCTICGKSERGFLCYAYGEDWCNYCKSCLSSEQKRRVKGIGKSDA